MNKKATLLRLTLSIIGVIAAVTGFACGFSGGRINLTPIPGLTYANSGSGLVIGTLGILIAAVEVRHLQYHEINLKPHI